MSPSRLVFLALLATPIAATASAQDAGRDAAAPSLEVRTDPGVPYHCFAVAVDPLAAFFGEYGLRVEGTAGAAHSLWARPAYLSLDDASALGLEVGYRLWPFADGLDGPFIGPAAGLAVTTDRIVTASASLEAGWQWVWEGIVLGASAGATLATTPAYQHTAISPRVTVSLGYAWM